VRKVGSKSNMVERSYADPQNNNYNMHGVGQIGLRQQKTPQKPIVR